MVRLITFDSQPDRRVKPDGVSPFQHSRRLFDFVASGTSELVGDLVRLPSGFEHRLHRHAHADQVLIITSGLAVAFGEDGAEVVVEPQQAIVFGAGEWHGVRAAHGACGLNLFPGVGRTEAAGFEPAPDPPASQRRQPGAGARAVRSKQAPGGNTHDDLTHR